jgi:hypothetical protein
MTRKSAAYQKALKELRELLSSDLADVNAQIAEIERRAVTPAQLARMRPQGRA